MSQNALSAVYKILVMTPVGRTETGQQIDYFPSRWSGSSGAYKVTTFYPYNLAYLTATLKRDTSHRVKMIDANYYGVDEDEYVDIVIKVDPDILIVEIDSIVFQKQMRIFERIKNFKPNLKIIACGPHLTAAPQDAPVGVVDHIALGEFEFSIPEFVNNGFNPATLGIYPNGKAPLVNVNELPLPENDDILRRNYCRLYGSEYNEVEVYATRGCPVMCNFCVVTNVYYSKPNYRTRNVNSVVQEIKYLMREIPELTGIFFNEEAHTINRKYLIELCNAFIESGLSSILKFNCMANFDTLDYEVLALMHRAGYYKIRIGIESLDEQSMKAISRGNLKSEYLRLIEMLEACKAVGVKVYGTMSVGTIASSYEKDIQSLNQVKELHGRGLLQEFSLSINTPMKGTPFYDHCLEKGWLIEGKNQFDGGYEPIVSFPHYSADQMRHAFAYGTEIRSMINQANMLQGVRYSSYDREWCYPVYETSKRRVGTGILV